MVSTLIWTALTSKLGFAGFVLGSAYVCMCVFYVYFLLIVLSLVVSASAIDCQDWLASGMTYCDLCQMGRRTPLNRMTFFTDILCLSSVSKAGWRYRTAETAVWYACQVYETTASEQRTMSAAVCSSDTTWTDTRRDLSVIKNVCCRHNRLTALSNNAPILAPFNHEPAWNAPPRSYLLRVQISLPQLFYCSIYYSFSYSDFPSISRHVLRPNVQ